MGFLPSLLTLHCATRTSYAQLIRSGQLPPPTDRYLDLRPGRPGTATFWSRQVALADRILVPSEFAAALNTLLSAGTRHDLWKGGK